MADNEALLRAIDAAEEHSYGGEGDAQLSKERALNIDAYLGKNIEPAPEGRSQVIDRTVFETVQWLLPSLCRIFANGDNVVSLAPTGEEDEQAAEQESDYLNYVVTQKNRWFDLILMWFQDALLTKNAYMMAFMDERVQTEKERYEGQTPEAVELLSQDDGVEILSAEEIPDETGEPVPLMDPFGQPVLNDMGQPVLQHPSIFNIELRRTQSDQGLSFRVLPPERVKVSDKTPDHTLSECDYFEYWDDTTLSDIRSMGFKIDDDVSDSSGMNDDEEDNARDRYGESFSGDDASSDPAMRRVRFRRIWIRHDTNEDGIAEMQEVIRVGNEILSVEEVTRIPVSCIVPTILTHRHMGVSVGDIVFDIQRIKSALLRQGIDNIFLTNNARMFVNPDKVNLDDVLQNRPGGAIRGKAGAVFGQDIAPIQTPFVFPQAVEGLRYMDEVREARSGVSQAFSGVDRNQFNQTATGIAQMSTMAAQRVEQIARIFAGGVQELFSIAHELIVKHGHKEEVVKLRNEWVTINPGNWRTKRDMRVVVGYAAGNKDAMVSRLMTILQAQREAIQIGVASPKNIYEALLELTKASDFTAPERFFTDPDTLPPPPPPEPDPLLLNAQADRESKERIEMAKLQQDTAESNSQLQFNEFKEKLEAELAIALKQMDLGGKAEIEGLKAELNMKPDLDLAAELNEVIGALQQESNAAQAELMSQLNATQQLASAPKELVRDKNGKVTGVRIGDTVRNVTRDEQGNVIGLE